MDVKNSLLLLTIASICFCHGAQANGELKFLRTNSTTWNLSMLDLYKTYDVENLLEQARTEQEHSLVNSACMSDALTIVAGMKSNVTSVKLTVARYVDAASKLPHGILQGRSLWVGDYQECLGLDSLENPKTGTSFRGKYFTVTIELSNFPLPNILYGLCLPDTCNEEDAKEIMSVGLVYIHDHYPQISVLSPKVTKAYTRPKTELTGGAIATIVVSVIILLLITVGTLLGLFYNHKPKQEHHIQEITHDSTNLIEPQLSEKTYLLEKDDRFRVPRRRGRVSLNAVVDLLKAFSFLDNARKLFGTATAHGPLACLNGLRVMSMWWVILGHTYEFATAVLDNPLFAMNIAKRFSFQPVINGTLSVDTFFFLSGLLVAYLALKEIREKGRISWVYYIVHRYWRLTPLYAFVILFFTNITKYLLYGPIPLGNFQQNIIDSCKKYWWTNLLYINNFHPNYGSLDDECLSWGWYLANDMQFYVFLGPIVIILLSRVRKIGVSVTVFLIFGGIFSRVFYVLYYGLHAPDNVTTKHTADPWSIGGMYIRPYTRWSVYLVGMLAGYVLARTKLRINMSNVVAVAGWCVATAVALATVYGQYHYYHHPGSQMTLIASVFYNSLNRTAWSLSLAWVVIACVAGKGGPVGSILSWAVWAPLGRLTYAAYLVHPIVLVAFYFNLHTPLHYTDLIAVYVYIGNLVITYGVAFVVSMAVEAPMIQMEKSVLKMFKKTA